MHDETTQDRPTEQSIPEGARAADAQNLSGMVAGGTDAEPAEGVLTLVCFKCGTEYFFTDEDPPGDMKCEKCGNTVFRSFFTPVDDEVAEDFRASTERDLAPDSASTETAPGDILDLDSR